MGLSKIKLGDYLERIYCKNCNNKYDEKDVRGVNNNKMLIKTRANINERDFSKFSIVKPGYFFFNHRTSRNGSKFSITYNYTNKHIIVTEDYVIFKIKNEDKLLKEWLYMFFNRPELDRYVITNSWGSSTEFYNWEDLCDIEIELPDLQTQEKYVSVYLSMLENQKNYERGLDDLKLVCDGYIEQLFSNTERYALRNYIIRRTEKNSDYLVKKLIGVGMSGFISPKQGKDETNGHICYLVRKNDFVYAPPQIHKGSLDLYKLDELAKCSDAYIVFYINNNVLINDYLFAILKTKIFQKYAAYYRDGVREQLDFEQFSSFEIPIPSIEIQKSIVNIFSAMNLRKQINEKLKQQIKDICPILIKGSIEEAKKV